MKMRQFLLSGVMLTSGLVSQEGWGVFSDQEKRDIVAPFVQQYCPLSEESIKDITPATAYVLSHLLPESTWGPLKTPDPTGVKSLLHSSTNPIDDLAQLANLKITERGTHRLKNQLLNQLSKLNQNGIHLVTQTPSPLYQGSTKVKLEAAAQEIDNLTPKDPISLLSLTLLLKDSLKLEKTPQIPNVSFKFTNRLKETEGPHFTQALTDIGALQASTDENSLVKKSLGLLAQQCTDLKNPNHLAGLLLWADHFYTDATERKKLINFGLRDITIGTDQGVLTPQSQQYLNYWMYPSRREAISNSFPPALTQERMERIQNAPDQLEKWMQSAGYHQSHIDEAWEYVNQLASQNLQDTSNEASDSEEDSDQETPTTSSATKEDNSVKAKFRDFKSKFPFSKKKEQTKTDSSAKNETQNSDSDADA